MSRRVTVINAASGVLGRAIADAALARGDAVAAIDFGPVERADGHDFLGLGGVDLTGPAAAQTAIDAAAQRFGRIDSLLNAVGGFVWQTTEGPLESWDRMHRMNLTTVLNTCPPPRPIATSAAGRIGNVGALGGLQAGAGMGAYAASKAGVHKLTETLAEATKASTLTVDAVLPSIIDTPRQPRRHGRRRLLNLGPTGGTGGGDAVPRQRCSLGGCGGAAPGQGTRLTPAQDADGMRVDVSIGMVRPSSENRSCSAQHRQQL